MEISIAIQQKEYDLITACVNQERWAQKHLYEDYYGMLMGVCMRYASNENDALDLLHEGFIKVFLNIGKYTPGTSLGSWMRRIMVNSCIDYYRKKIRRRTEDIDQVYDLKSDDADAISQLSEQDILSAMQRLPDVYRTVFNLYVLEGFSHKEIAEQLEINESTSRSNLAKARAKLRMILIKKDGVAVHED